MSESNIQPDPPPQQSPAAAAPAPTAGAVDVRRPDSALAAVVPYRNPWALIAYYCGVFSLLPVLGLILAPLAVIFGIVGLRRVRRDPQARGTGHAWIGIILGSILALLNWGTLGYCIWAINHDDTWQRIYREAFEPPPDRLPEPD